MARNAAQREWEAAHEDDNGQALWHDGSFRNWSRSYSKHYPYHRDDGVTVLVDDADDGSWDELLGRATERPSDLHQRDQRDHDAGE
jgi:hypothetical protein